MENTYALGCCFLFFLLFSLKIDKFLFKNLRLTLLEYMCIHKDINLSASVIHIDTV